MRFVCINITIHIYDYALKTVKIFIFIITQFLLLLNNKV